MAIIADDVTGAADTGAAFAQMGLATTLAFADEPLSAVDILVRSTESRGLDVSAAALANERAAMALTAHSGGRQIRWVYKKIDSALRGYPAEELLAVMAGLGETRAVVACALPSEERTTVGGRQYVRGFPLEAGPLGQSNVPCDLVALFGQSHDIVVRSLGLAVIRQGVSAIQRFLRNAGSGVVVADAETDLDLAVLASAIAGSDVRVLCGSAGFARQLAGALPLMPLVQPSIRPPRGTGPVLVVAGSQHPATTAQVDVLGRAGHPAIHLDQDLIDDPSTSIDGTVAKVAMQLSAGRSPVLTTVGLALSPLGESFVVERLSEIVAAPPVRRHLGGLVLTGGHVAAGIFVRLRASALRLGGEIRPAMPWGVLDAELVRSVPVATKAGSFGASDALLACVSHLG
ncbi:MAG TPA: four-carbon acid sugar kinase family protein, partial [Thermomicrobiales bacterium]|nr:four-carbon acid sugar kinase family protein [Thermomicrobiales bacterium]